MEAIRESTNYTYADYCQWNDDIRRELIDGIIYMIAPSPSEAHQSISIGLLKYLISFLDNKPCRVFHAPFDVRLSDDTVVQPDIFVVCDRSKLDGKSVKGAPDLIIEILSPSSGKLDKVIKLNKYREAGVREYWIVDPTDKTVISHVLKDDNYIVGGAYTETDTAPVAVLEGCEINLQDVFNRM